MKRLKELYEKYLSGLNMYWVVIIVFLILIFFAGDSSLYKRYTYDEKIRSLKEEIEYYKKEIEENPSIRLNNKPCRLVPVLKMKMV